MKNIKLDTGFKCFIYSMGCPFHAGAWTLHYWESNEELYLWRFWLNLKGVTLTKWWEKLFWSFGCIIFGVAVLFILWIVMEIISELLFG